MIKSNDEGNIIVDLEEESFDLMTSDGYSRFLLWISSPDPDVSIDEEMFSVASDIKESAKAKAERYSVFLKDFAVRREEKLKRLSDGSLPEKRETEADALLEHLKEATSD